MTEQAPISLQLSDIQASILRTRPPQYRGEYILLRIEDGAQGREMLRRLIPHVASADPDWEPTLAGWLGLGLTYSGLEALEVPESSLSSFPEAFRQGMAARATKLRDFGHNAPSNWEEPLGSLNVHVALAIFARNDEELVNILERAKRAHEDLPAVSVIYRLPFRELPEGRNPFGFKDGLHNPQIEGFPDASAQSFGVPVKAGEFIMGYEDEEGRTAIAPEPYELRHNGTFMVFRKFHTHVAEFRRYLHEQASDPDDQELIAAKMVGRWRSGAPLVLAAERDNPELGKDQARNNLFGYSDDLKGLKCPFSAHMRRVNPRDALANDLVAVNLHQFLRRGTNYGPPLPESIMTDDGIDRGGVFLFIGAHLDRQFEFVQSQWIADGNFIGHGTEEDPILGNAAHDGVFTIPRHPFRRRLHGLPRFVTVQGGEYCFLPGLRALRWIAENVANPSQDQ